jgi:glycosyltransferase involved in cell wall biosynthesis
MRITKAHNYYIQRGGEDRSFADETQLLMNYGHEVSRYVMHNNAIMQLGRLTSAAATIWNQSVFQELRKYLANTRSEVIHFHNQFPLISPAAYYAAKDMNVVVVQTLHNYRLLCPSAIFFRDEHVCGACRGKSVPWPSVRYGCYRGSRAATGAVATMLTLHRVLGTWVNKVDLYVSLTEFARQQFIAEGFPAEKLVVKPNFVHPDPGVGEGRGGYALFVGRLAPEKGIRTLLAAWEHLAGRMPLKIIGDGPLAAEVERAVTSLPGVEWLGERSAAEVYEFMGGAAFLIFPSEWYETFGRVAIEAFAKGTPVIAADVGAVAEVTEDGRTGLHFRAGNAEDLASKVSTLISQPQTLTQMRREARAEYEAKYTAEKNYNILSDIYSRAIDSAASRRS